MIEHRSKTVPRRDAPLRAFLNLFGAVTDGPGLPYTARTAPRPTFKYMARRNVRETAAAKKRARRLARNRRHAAAMLAGKQLALAIVDTGARLHL